MCSSDLLAPFLPAWQRYDVLAGRPIRLLEGDRVQDGVALGVDGDGALRLRGDDGRERRVHAGEATLRAA